MFNDFYFKDDFGKETIRNTPSQSPKIRPSITKKKSFKPLDSNTKVHFYRKSGSLIKS